MYVLIYYICIHIYIYIYDIYIYIYTHIDIAEEMSTARGPEGSWGVGVGERITICLCVLDSITC